MATVSIVSLDFIKKAAATAASKAAAGVRIDVTMAGGDRWITNAQEGSVQRDFNVKLKG